MSDLKLPYTLCFIKQQDHILMLNRLYEPNKGLWNGVGGKIQAEETPYDCILREVKEETGLSLKVATFKGIVTWEGEEIEKSGMYVYLADLAESQEFDTPIRVDEGILEWHHMSWILDSLNDGVVSNIRRFLPTMLREDDCYEHQCYYSDGRLINFRSVPYERETVANQSRE